MMNKTKIEWCDMTWNPVTGCYHGCEYCYARRIAERFKGEYNFETLMHEQQTEFPCVVAEKYKSPYPCGFTPTFHSYRLDEPQRVKKPQTIFVCSMADLFGEWVPDEWIERVFHACEKAPWHRYLFLTKNPYRYAKLLLTGRLIDGEHIWLGTTLTGKGKLPFNAMDSKQNFVSMEPLLEPVSDKFPYTNIQWIIIGAETGNRKGRVIPQRSWIEDIAKECDKYNIPVFMKDSLIPIIGEAAMRREFPWDAEWRQYDE